MASNPGSEEVTTPPEPAWVAELRGKMATMISGHETVLGELRSLRAYVETIESEAKSSMEKFTSPEAMMEMAGKFLGTPG